MVKWEVVGSYKKYYNIMERAPRNTHEQIHIDMSIILIEIKKIHCNVQAYGLWSDSFLKE